jgi:hypothetical protein
MSNRKPTHHLFIPATEASTPWTYVGSAWDLGEGRYNIIVNRPLEKGTKVQLRRAKAKSAEAQAAAKAETLEAERRAPSQDPSDGVPAAHLVL